jgi:hypothetical protein
MENNKTKRNSKLVSLQALLERCRKDANGDTALATKLMIAAVASEPALKEALLQMAVHDLGKPVTARDRRAAFLLEIMSQLKPEQNISDCFTVQKLVQLARRHSLSPKDVAAMREPKEKRTKRQPSSLRSRAGGPHKP